MQSSPLPCYLIPLWPKYPPQHFILETSLPKVENNSVTYGLDLVTVTDEESFEVQCGESL